MSIENNSANNEFTDNSTESQAEKTFTQAELNAILAKTKSQLEKKFESRYADLGDPDELREIVANHRKNREDYEIRKGNFDKILQEKLSAKDQEIARRDRMIESFKVETPIVEAASRHRAVAPEQVKALVRSQVRLNPEGEPEVLDEKGAVRYDDNGRPLSVDAFIQEFLNKNPHFVQATPSTTATRSQVGARTDKLDVSKLDMKNPEHRKLYAEYRKNSAR